jgi:hypothetical protein
LRSQNTRPFSSLVCLTAGLFDGDDEGRAVFPFPYHVRDHFGRILQIGGHAHYGVTGGLMEGMHGRADVAEVAGVGDDLHVLIPAGKMLEDGEGVIARAIVDEDVFVPVAAESGENGAHALVEFAHVGLFVVAGANDADGLHVVWTSG